MSNKLIIYIKSNIFTSPATVIVNTVNTVGVMGKGLALEFKKIFPDMYKDYRKRCKDNTFHVGQLLLYKSPNKWVLNFPTKRSWRQNSKLSDIKLGLEKFIHVYKYLGITSVAFPELGVGNGNLDWKTQVQPLMEHYLSNLPIYVYIHLYDENQYLPLRTLREYVKATPLQLNYSQFIKQLRRGIKNNNLKFITYPKRIYKNEMSTIFKIVKNKHAYYLTRHDIEETLNVLKTNGILLPFNYPTAITLHNDYSLYNQLMQTSKYITVKDVNINNNHLVKALLLNRI